MSRGDPQLHIQMESKSDIKKSAGGIAVTAPSAGHEGGSASTILESPDLDLLLKRIAIVIAPGLKAFLCGQEFQGFCEQRGYDVQATKTMLEAEIVQRIVQAATAPPAATTVGAVSPDALPFTVKIENISSGDTAAHSAPPLGVKQGVDRVAAVPNNSRGQPILNASGHTGMSTLRKRLREVSGVTLFSDTGNIFTPITQELARKT